MKNVIINIIFLLLIFSFSHANAEIKNGYGDQICMYKASYCQLADELKDEDISTDKIRFIRKSMTAIKRRIVLYELTETLLNQFLVICRGIYYAVDTLKDARLRSVDVYVRFVPGNKMPNDAFGTTNINRDENDPTAYRSEYGKNTVSIKVEIRNNSLTVLAHELGHAFYNVQNIETYFDSYSRLYRHKYEWSKVEGHNDKDLGGQKAEEFEIAFKRVYKNKFESPVVLIQDIEKNIDFFSLNVANLQRITDL